MYVYVCRYFYSLKRLGPTGLDKLRDPKPRLKVIYNRIIITPAEWKSSSNPGTYLWFSNILTENIKQNITYTNVFFFNFCFNYPNVFNLFKSRSNIHIGKKNTNKLPIVAAVFCFLNYLRGTLKQ